jgi:hypothetical protein
MSDNYFVEEIPVPDVTAIKAALGDRYPWYEGILEAARGFQQDWKHYGRKYGWKMKIHDGSKALLELTVASRNFRIGMAVRERELEALRNDPVASSGLADLLAADRSKEGWGIRLTIESEGAYRQAILLIGAVAAIRRAI